MPLRNCILHPMHFAHSLLVVPTAALVRGGYGDFYNSLLRHS